MQVVFHNAGAEEEPAFCHTVREDIQHAADKACFIADADTKQDERKLADRRIRDDALDIGLYHGTACRDERGDGGNDRHDLRKHRIDCKRDREETRIRIDTDFDQHRRVQQRGDG
ncbi:hypothetical protein SDC9_208477 [bioreactor metagenome]|uniref:Uncharacterized protein n=1 Tax=bioreactor metagenome TaxID=1076179 RepID=A0A645JAP5_9ZZZZ